ncbi:MAG: TonB-dependent receptor [Gammaproteobacteria bacterium]|nr:TonB-dependent receptor [Gammaproteobacteria bacterium]
MTGRITLSLGALAAAVAASAPAAAQSRGSTDARVTEEVVVTTAARRREEAVQEVPIPISIVDGSLITDSGSFNVNRVKELVPTVQLYSSNPRNTGVNIRGLGAPFGLTNDGIEPGVGFYVDGVLYSRPAATMFDFIDVERVEVLRGPQGTLFGKNTTAGAILVTTRKPSFTPEANLEFNVGDYDYWQAKGSFTGPLSERVAGRISYSVTRRDGNVYHVVTGEHLNNLDNTGVRGQLLITPSDAVDINISADYTTQSPDGYAQVFAGVVPTLRPEYRQFEAIIDHFGYEPPSRNPFDRLVDHDTPWKSGNDMGGVALNVDAELGPGTLTSTTAWRFWVWDPSNDRDFLGLPVTTLSQAPSKHEQWSQEVRWAGDLGPRLSGVFGFYAFDQKLNTDPVHTEATGSALYRFLWTAPNTPAAATPEAYDGQRREITSELNTVSAALFGQVDWAITDKLHLQPGLRYNYDQKDVWYVQRAINVPDPAPPGSYGSSQFTVDVDDTNLSGNLTLKYDATDKVSTYATYSTGFKSVGVNVGGLPLTAEELQDPVLVHRIARVQPEEVRHVEVGVKTSPSRTSAVNFTLYQTVIEDYQTVVFGNTFSNPRGYLANAEEVRVRGFELDANGNVGDAVSLRAALVYADGEYVSFTNAPPPLEGTGGPPSVDASGGRLPGLSKWAASVGGEHRVQVTPLGVPGELYTGLDVYYRDDFSSSPTPSQYLNIDGYALVNLRLGFRSQNGWSVQLWSRNLLDEEYFEQLLAAPGGNGAGHYGAVLGDPRTFGISFRLDL